MYLKLHKELFILVTENFSSMQWIPPLLSVGNVYVKIYSEWSNPIRT